MSTVNPTQPQSHAYPELLAAQSWPTWLEREKKHFALRTVESFSGFLSVAYQASLLNEEGQPVICRIALCHASELEASNLSFYSFNVSRLRKPRPFDQQEIRRLSPAATFYRSIIAVTWSPEAGFAIRGTVQTGQWSRDLVADLQGMMHPIPNWLIIHVRGPGNLVIYRGSERLATLLNGRIEGHGFNVFASSWMRECYWNVKNGSADLRSFAAESGLEFRPDLLENFDANFFKRVVREIRDKRRGGTIVSGPETLLAQLLDPGGPLCAKYRVDKQWSSRPYQALMEAIIGRIISLAKMKGKESIGWLELLEWSEEMPYSISTRYLDLAGWLADMATVDGCLLLDPRFSVLGYGVEIQVPGFEEEIVHRALDLEAEYTIPESAEHAGTRHRTAYRLCRDFPQCLAVVVSQDGTVQFVANHNGRVTYWSHLNF
jgi:sensor domain DACNV-containing protein